MKKIFAGVLTCIIVASLALNALAVENVVEDNSNEGKRTVNTGYVFDPSTVPEAVRGPILEMREEPADDLTDTQIRTLYAMGLTDEEISGLNKGEVSDWLCGGEILYPDMLEPEIDFEALVYRIAEEDQNRFDSFSRFNLTEQEIYSLIDLGVSPYNYEKSTTELHSGNTSVEDDLRGILSKHSSKI